MPRSVVPEIRMMRRRDLAQVVAIQNHWADVTQTYKWNEEGFCTELRRTDTIGKVALAGQMVLGYVVYRLHEKSIKILDFRVRADCLRAGIGTALMEMMRLKLHPVRRTRMVFLVRERHLVLQQFLRSQGFKAIRVLRERFMHKNDDNNIVFDDGIVFDYRVDDEVPLMAAPICQEE